MFVCQAAGKGKSTESLQAHYLSSGPKLFDVSQ